MNSGWKKKLMNIIKKWGDFQLALQLGFWIAMTICNSFQLNVFLQLWMLSNKLHEMHLMQLTICETIYICNSITTIV